MEKEADEEAEEEEEEDEVQVQVDLRLEIPPSSHSRLILSPVSCDTWTNCDQYYNL